MFGDHVWASARTWDPEGLLSTIPAIATTLIGVSAGRTILSDRPPWAMVRSLLVRGGSLGLIGFCWSAWLHFPINKNLWTSSYALFTGGLAMCVLAVCVWLSDIRGHRRVAHPFTVYGVNALTVFVMSGVVARLMSAIRWHEDTDQVVTLKQAVYRACYTSWIGDPYLASLAFALTWVACWYAVLAVMFRRGIVIKL